MEVSQAWSIWESPALRGLGHFVRQRQQAWPSGTPSFEQFEQDVHAQVMALERELLAAELARYDVDAEQIEVAGVRYHPVGEASETRCA